jgi:glycosyltransferase involved in cell wall biosynthesis
LDSSRTPPHALGYTKNEFLSQAIALLLPVDIEEAFGLVLVEAMMCGTPAIAFRRGAIPEIIDEGNAGIESGDLGGWPSTRLL